MKPGGLLPSPPSLYNKQGNHDEEDNLQGKRHEAIHCRSPDCISRAKNLRHVDLEHLLS